jgi:hypothetical protein
MLIARQRAALGLIVPDGIAVGRRRPNRPHAGAFEGVLKGR